MHGLLVFSSISPLGANHVCDCGAKNVFGFRVRSGIFVVSFMGVWFKQHCWFDLGPKIGTHNFNGCIFVNAPEPKTFSIKTPELFPNLF